MKNINKILKVSEELYKKSLWSYFFYKKAARVVEYVPSSSGGQSMGYYSGGYDEGEESLQKYSYNENNPQSILNSGAKELLNDLSPSEFKNKLNELVNSFETCTNLFEQADRKNSFSDEDIGVIRKLSNNFFENYKKVIADNYHQNALIQDWKENVDVAEAGRVIKDMYEFVEIKSRSYVSTLFSDLIEEYEDSISSGEDPGEIEDSIGEIFESKSEEQEAQAKQNTEDLLNKRKKSSEASKEKYLKKIKEYRPLSQDEKAKLQSMMEEIQKNPQAKLNIIKRYKDEAEAKNQLFIMKDYHQSYLNLLAQQRASKKNRIERLKREALEGNEASIQELAEFRRKHIESNKDYFNWEKIFQDLSNIILNILGEKYSSIAKEINLLGKIPGKKLDKQIQGLNNKKEILIEILKTNVNDEIFETIINNIESIQIKQKIKEEIQRKETQKKQEAKNIQSKGEGRNYSGMMIKGYLESLKDDLGNTRSKVKSSVEKQVLKLIKEKITNEDKIKLIKREKIEIEFIENKKLEEYKELIESITNSVTIERTVAKIEESKEILQNLLAQPLDEKNFKKIKDLKILIKNQENKFKESVRSLREKILNDILSDNEEEINKISNILKIDPIFSKAKKIQEINKKIKELNNFFEESLENSEFSELNANIKKEIEELKKKIKKEAKSYLPITDIAKSVIGYRYYAKYRYILTKYALPIEQKIKDNKPLNNEDKIKIQEIIDQGKDILSKHQNKYFGILENQERKTKFYVMNTLIDVLLKYLQGFLDNQIVILTKDEISESHQSQGYEKE